MKRARTPRRDRALRPGAPPARRTALRRRTPMARGSAPLRQSTVTVTTGAQPRHSGFAASDAQRAKIVGAACVVCQQTKGITPAHLAARAAGGCEHPDCVVALCRMHHRTFDTRGLDLLPYLEPRHRAEIAHAVGHLGLISAYRRLTGGRLPAGDLVPSQTGDDGRG